MASADSDIIVRSLDGVQKSYDGENLVVKDLNLRRIERGEFLTMLGPSGSGKTTVPDDAGRLRDGDSRRDLS